MIYLSYSTISDYYKAHHSYLNYIMGIKKPVSPQMEQGKKDHETIQAHCLGGNNPALENVKLRFTQKEYEFRVPWDSKYGIHGFIDLWDKDTNSLAEIKTGSAVWSLRKFMDLMQWRLYAKATETKQCYGISCIAGVKNARVYPLPYTQKDAIMIDKWVTAAIEMIDAKKFTDDLIEEKWCTGNCGYRDNCRFYKP